MSSDNMQSGDEEEVPPKNDPWNAILQEISDSERRTEDRLKRRKADVQWGQEKVLEKAAK